VANTIPQDKSNGYEPIAATFMRARNPRIGPATARQWSKSLPPGTAILDLGCGYGVPISQALIDEGFAVYGVDASPSLLDAFRERVPNARSECAAVEESDFFRRTFDAIVAWGLMFLLPAETQTTVIKKVARALNSGGRFLFTSLAKPLTWSDALTGRTSISLGRERYEEILRAEGLRLEGDAVDEGDNYYYFVRKPPTVAE
jgi:SAM-dependent methyltransferase